MLLKKLPVNPYSSELWIIISGNPDIDIKRLNKKFPGLSISWGKDYAAWTNDHYYDDCVIAVAFDASCMDVSTIAHEATHIANLVFKHAGVIFDKDNDEPLAYLIGWISGQIHDLHLKYLKQQKKK